MTAFNPDWNLVKSFLAVYEEKSLSAAARKLRLSQPTVGRHIEALEETLQLPLFTRSQTGLIATEAAHNLVSHAQSMETAAAALVRSASGNKDAVSGTVRIAASEVIGAEILPDMLRQFSEQYPDISVELALSSQSDDLLKREADIAIRMFRPTQDALVARKICDTPLGLFAHKSYLEKYGVPVSIDNLENHKGIGPDNDPVILKRISDHGFPANREFLTYRTDNDLTQHALIRAGNGIGGMQIRLARREPDLIQIFANEVSLPMEMWLVMHEDLRGLSQVRVLYTFMADYLVNLFSDPL